MEENLLKKNVEIRYVNVKKESSISYPILSKTVFEKCKLIHIQVLKTLYANNMPVAYIEIYDNFKVLRISDKTFRKRIYELKQWGLIDTVSSGILLLIPKTEMREEMIQIINNFLLKLGETRDN